MIFFKNPGSCIFYFIVLGVLFISCDKNGEDNYPIPGTATTVIKIDPYRISKKVLLDKIGEINIFDLFKSAKEDTTLKKENIFSILENPQKAGIEVLEDIYLFNDRDLIGIFASLDDDDKFSEFLKTTLDKKINKTDNYQYTQIDNIIVAWQKGHCLFLINKNQNEISEEDLKRIIKTPKEAAIFSNKNFIVSQNRESDIIVWGNTEKLFNEFYFPETITSYFPKSPVHAYINFEDGKITLEANQFLNPKDLQILKKQELGNYLDFIRRENTVAAGRVSFDLKNIFNLAKKDSIQQILNTLELNEKDILDAFTGQILFSYENLKEKDKEIITYTYDEDFNKSETIEIVKQKFPSFTLLLPVKNNEKVNYILSKLEKSGLLSKAKDHYNLVLSEGEIHLFQLPEGVILSDSSVYRTSTKQLSPEIQQHLNSYPLSLFIDSKGLLKQVSFLNQTSTFQEFENILVGLSSEKEKITLNISLNLNNKEKNSFLMLAEIIKNSNKNSRRINP